MGRGEYGRGGYRASYPPWLGRELSDEEIHKATAAGEAAAAPLFANVSQLGASWPANKPLTPAQMMTIMQEALKVAREAEKNLVELIAKVPAYWEDHLRTEGGLKQLQQGLADAPKFEALINTLPPQPIVVPGFRLWVIQRLLVRSVHAVAAIAYVSDVLPSWLHMRDILASLHRGAVAAINGILSVGGAAVEVVRNLGGAAVDTFKALPTIAKVAGIGVLAIGGVWIVSKLSAAKAA